MAVAFLVGLGLCGLDIALGSHGIGKINEEFSVGPLDGVSLVVMALSAAGLVLSLIVWMLAAIVTSITESGANDGDPIKLFGDEAKSKHDNDKSNQP